MRARPGAGEGPLVVFTVLTQTAVGLWAAAAVLGRAAMRGEEAGLALLLVAAGAVVAVVHLGRPLPAALSLANLRSSWLSREIALGLLFAAGMAAGLACRWSGGPDGVPAGLAVAGVLLGLALVYAMARVYMLRTVPPWDTWATPAAFFGTTLLLGLALHEAAFGVPDAAARGVGLAVFGLAVVQVVTGSLQARRFGLRPEHRLPFGARGVLALVGAGAIAGGRGTSPVIAGLGFALLLVSELLGRFLFYAAHHRLGL